MENRPPNLRTVPQNAELSPKPKRLQNLRTVPCLDECRTVPKTITPPKFENCPPSLKMENCPRNILLAAGGFGGRLQGVLGFFEIFYCYHAGVLRMVPGLVFPGEKALDRNGDPGETVERVHEEGQQHRKSNLFSEVSPADRTGTAIRQKHTRPGPGADTAVYRTALQGKMTAPTS